MKPQPPQSEDWLDDLLNHLVIREGNGPNGSSGEIRYWKNGKDIPAKQTIIEGFRARLPRKGEFKHPITGEEVPRDTQLWETGFNTALDIVNQLLNELRGNV